MGEICLTEGGTSNSAKIHKYTYTQTDRNSLSDTDKVNMIPNQSPNCIGN